MIKDAFTKSSDQTQPQKNSENSTEESTNNNQGSGQGRGKNQRKPDPDAQADHSVIDDKGSTTFKKNEKNPKGWDKDERIDTKGSSHTNSDGTIVPTPHKHLPGKKDVIPLNPGVDPMPKPLQIPKS